MQEAWYVISRRQEQEHANKVKTEGAVCKLLRVRRDYAATSPSSVLCVLYNSPRARRTVHMTPRG